MLIQAEKYEKIWNLTERKFRIGRYFVGATEWILGAHNPQFERCFENDPCGDLYRFGKLSAILEVKASNNSHAWPIYIDQLDQHIEDARNGFPLNRCLYVLYRYKDRTARGGERVSLIGKTCKTQRQLEKGLAKNLQTAYIIDAEILNRMKSLVELRHDTWAELNHRPFMPIYPSMLSDMAFSPRIKLANIGLKEDRIASFVPPGAKRIRPIRVRTTYRNDILDFDIVPIVSLGQRRLIKESLNGTVIPRKP